MPIVLIAHDGRRVLSGAEAGRLMASLPRLASPWGELPFVAALLPTDQGDKALVWKAGVAASGRSMTRSEVLAVACLLTYGELSANEVLANKEGDPTDRVKQLRSHLGAGRLRVSRQNGQQILGLADGGRDLAVLVALEFKVFQKGWADRFEVLRSTLEAAAAAEGGEGHAADDDGAGAAARATPSPSSPRARRMPRAAAPQLPFRLSRSPVYTARDSTGGQIDIHLTNDDDRALVVRAYAEVGDRYEPRAIVVQDTTVFGGHRALAEASVRPNETLRAAVGVHRGDVQTFLNVSMANGRAPRVALRGDPSHPPIRSSE